MATNSRDSDRRGASPRSTGGRGRLIAAWLAGLVAAGAWLTPPAWADAAAWRLLLGPGLEGLMRESPDPAPAALGFFVIAVDDPNTGQTQVYEGLYNAASPPAASPPAASPSGASGAGADGAAAPSGGVLGMFWEEGALNRGLVAGFLDIGPDGGGALSFTDGRPDRALQAR